jgi:hypothetical protein
MKQISAEGNLDSDARERLIALACWFILVLKDQRDPSADDMAYQMAEEGDDSRLKRHIAKYEDQAWRDWRQLGAVDSDAEFDQILTKEILPDLKERFHGTGSPLALLPEVMAELPIPTLRTMLQTALEYDADSTQGAEDLPLDEMLNFWDVWDRRCKTTYNRIDGELDYDVAHFLAQSIAPSRTEHFYDPCARAGMLARETTSARLCGRITLVEQHPKLAAIAAARLLLHTSTQDDLYVYTGQPFALSKLVEKCDCIIANPPWGQRYGKPPVGAQFRIESKSSESLYLQHVLNALAPGGRAAVLMPNSFLFRESERPLREILLREYCVEAVVESAAGFSQPSAVRCAIIYIRKAPPRSNVWFISGKQFDTAMMNSAYPEKDLDSSGLLAALHARLHLTDDYRRNFPELDSEPISFPAWLDELAGRSEEPDSREAPDDARRLSENNQRLLTLARAFHIGHDEPSGGDSSLTPIESLARRDWELLWKEERSEELSRFLAGIDQESGTRIATLGELATDIFVGYPYSSATTDVNIGGIFAAGEPDTAVGLVRVSDLPKPKAEGRTLIHAHKALKPEAAAEVPPRQLLQPGDLLISRSGTVGRTGVYVAHLGGDPSQPSVATNGIIVVRLGDESRAHYLADLLQTAPYQEALQAESTGSFIRHLRADTLRTLAVPDLPRSEMVRLREVIRPGVSAETMLAALVSRPGYTQALHYLLDRTVVREFAARPLDEP